MDGIIINTKVSREGVFSHLINADNHNEQLYVEFVLSGGSLRCIAKGSNHRSEYHVGACNSLEEAKRCLPALAIENGLNIEEKDLQGFVETVWQFNTQLRNHLKLMSM